MRPATPSLDYLVTIGSVICDGCSDVWWIVCKADTLNKYLKASGLAPPNIQFKGWHCQAADIVDTFIPYLKTLPACHPNFMKVSKHLSKAGIIS